MPSVVALGGGHGLAQTLRAAREYAGATTAVVSVADDGGSSGRLRRDLGVLPPGDLRECLAALAADPQAPWTKAFQHRFVGGELDGHALGNLVLVALAEVLGDWQAALAEAGRLLGAVGRVLPVTTEPLELRAEVAPDSWVVGQVAVSEAPARIRRVELVPAGAAAFPAAVEAVLAADQVVLAPGSLFTSLLPVACVLRDAIGATSAQIVQVANLRQQVPETAGLDGTEHLRAVLEHGIRVDVFLYQAGGELATDEALVRGWGVRPLGAQVAAEVGYAGAHDPGRLAKALADLLR
jgi:uncharacterized cofD-like protein